MTDNYDLLIKDTTIIDGSGKPAFKGSVAVKGEKIVAMGDIPAKGAQVIDGSGLITCPGFVDPHNHADFSILQHPLAENLIMQGITTVMVGNCGFCPGSLHEGTWTSHLGPDYPVDWNSYDEWLSKIDAAGPAVNILSLVGHNTIRETVMGQDFRRAASDAEVNAMKSLVEEAMKSGAFGLSAGLDMPWPGFYANRQETIALAKIAQEYGGLFAPHTRHLRAMWPTDEPTELLYSMFYGPKGETIAGRYHGFLEVVEMSRLANGIPLHIAHLAEVYDVSEPHPEFLDEALARATLVEIVEKPRDQGLDVTYNAIASVPGITGPVPMIKTFFSQIGPPPPWLEGVQAQGQDGFIERLKTRAFRDELKAIANSGRFKIGMVHPLKDPYWMDCYRVLKCAQSEYVGQTIDQIARAREPHDIVKVVYDTSFEVIFDILVADPDATWVMDVDKRSNFTVLSVFLQHPAGVPCTDVDSRLVTPPSEDKVGDHGVAPTAFSMYPQYISTFVKENAVLSLVEAIKKATSVPAQIFGITDRGLLQEGAYADILMFDLEAMDKGGGFADPTRRPAGIKHVLVNGQVVYQNMSHTGAGPGRVLRRS